MSGAPEGGPVQGWVQHLVSRGTSVEVPPPPPGSLTGFWDPVLQTVRGGRITGTLVDLLMARPGLVPDGARAQALEVHREAMVVALRLERRLLRVHAALTSAGIGHIVLKGPAVAHLDNVDASLRDFGDIDVLVRSADVDGSAEALAAAGHRRVLPAAHPRLDRVFAKSVTFLGPDGLEVDLHRTLCPGSFGLTLPLDALWSGPDRFTVGGQVMRALARPLRLVHTAAHLRLGSVQPRLSTRRDLLVQADLVPVTDAAGAAHRLGLEIVLQAAVAQAGAAGTPLPGPYVRWAGSFSPDPVDASRLERHLAAGDDFGLRTRPVLRELRWGDRATVLRALLLPRADHLAARGLSRGQHLGRLWARLRVGPG